VERRIEMHLRSRAGKRCTFRPPVCVSCLDEDENHLDGKLAQVSSPKKIPRDGPRARDSAAMGQWIDREWPFAQNLLIADREQSDW